MASVMDTQTIIFQEEKSQNNDRKRKTIKKLEIFDKDKNRISIYSGEITKRCRTCLVHEGIINVFKTQHNEVLFSDLFAMFSLCTMRESDGLPQRICAVCAKFIIELHTFKSQVHQSLLTLQFALGKFHCLNMFSVPLLQTNKTADNSILDDDNEDQLQEEADSTNPKNSMNTVSNEGNQQNGENITRESDATRSGFDENETSRSGFENEVHENLDIDDESTKTAFEDSDYEDDMKRKDYEISKKNIEDIINHSLQSLNNSTKTCNDLVKPTVIMTLHSDNELETSKQKESGLNNNMMPNKDNSNITYSICNKTFLTKAEYNRHRKEKTEKEGRRKKACEICFKPVPFYTMEKHLEIHKICHEENINLDSIEIVTDDQSFDKIYEYKDEECVVADHDYAKGDLIKHNSEDDSGQKIYTCKMCKMAFNNLKEFDKHKRYEKEERQRINCPICEKNIQNYKMEEHIALHIKKNAENNQIPQDMLETSEYTCKCCNLKFSTRLQFILHKRREEKRRQSEICFNNVNNMAFLKVACSICNKLISKYKLKHHMTCHNNEQACMCDICGKIVRSQSSLRVHKYVHSKNSALCDMCGKIFSNQGMLNTHKKKNHLGIKHYQCRFCDKQFLLRNELKVHTRSHTGERPYLCAVCGKTFVQVSHLRTHTAITHNIERPFACKICNQSFAIKNYLTQHINWHIYGSTVKGTPKQCEICNKLVKNINAHNRRHLDEEPKFCEICNIVVKCPSIHRHIEHRENKYVCSICNKSYLQRTQLSLHQRTHPELMFKCDQCEKYFSSKQFLKIHQRIHTGERPYKCKLCGSSFIQHPHLNYHMKVHKGEKPHACPYCDKRFTLNGNLKQHIMFHTNERPFVCDICSKGFISGSSLRKHKLTHTKNDH